MTTQQYCTGGCAPAARLAGRRSPYGSVRGGATPLLLALLKFMWVRNWLKGLQEAQPVLFRVFRWVCL